jgi:TonB family protein
MKNTVIYCWFLPLLCLLSFKGGPEVIKKKVSENGINETYYVLKSDGETKHGSYLKTGRGDKEEGNYDMGVKSGVWSYKFGNGFFQKYDYTNKTLLIPTFEGEQRALVEQDGLFVEKAVNYPATHLGGKEAMYSFLVMRVIYPKEAKRKGTQGELEASFEITENGEIINETIINGIGDGCDEELLRVLKLLPDTWFPANIDGKPVKSRVIMPFTFKLS